MGRQSQAKDQKAKNAALQAEAARTEDLKNTLTPNFNSEVEQGSSLPSIVIESGEQFGEEGLSIGSMGQSVIIADLGQNSNPFYGQERPVIEEKQEDVVSDGESKRRSSKIGAFPEFHR